MHHTQVKKYAKQYADQYNEIGESALKLKLAEETSFEDVEIEDIIDKIKEGDPADGKDSKPKAAKLDKTNANSEFEEWKVSLKNPEVKENKDESFDKVRRIKNVRIPEDMAERMNEHSAQSNLRYYAV